MAQGKAKQFSKHRYVLPVDSPDAKHSCASTLADAASLYREERDGKARSVAFMAIDVRERL